MENNSFSSPHRSKTFFNTTKSGFINTLLHQEDQDFTKSRIQHLPSYQKTDLSNKLQFVVVFQTIEIERLSQEIESLRVMLKDSERQINNYQSYEVQIKELTQNCHLLEDQRINYQNQAEQMSLACNTLYEEMTQIKKQYEKEIDQLKKQNRRDKEEFNIEKNELRKKIKEFEQMMLIFKQEEEKNQKKMKVVSQELVRLNQELLQSQMKLNIFRQKQNQWKNTFQAEKERRLKAEQMTKILEHQTKEIEKQLQKQKRNVIDHLQRQKDELKQKLQNQELQFKKQFESLRKRQNSFKDELQMSKNENTMIKKQLQSDRQQLNYMKRANDSMKNEFDTLRQHLDGIVNELQKQKHLNENLTINRKDLERSLSIEKQKAEKITQFSSELRRKIQQKCFELSKLKQMLQKINVEWENTVKKERILTEQVSNFEPVLSQNQSMKEEMIRVGSLLIDREEELSASHCQYRELNQKQKQYEITISQLENNLKNSTQILKELESKLNQERQNSQNNKEQMKNELNVLKKEKETFSRELQRVLAQGLIKDQLKLQIKKLGQTCKIQEDQIHKMIKHIQKLVNIIQQLKKKQENYHVLNKVNKMLQEKLGQSLIMNQQLLNKIGILYRQNESLNEEIDRLMTTMKEERFNRDLEFPSNNTYSSVNTFRTQYTLNDETSKINQPIIIPEKNQQKIINLPPKLPKIIHNQLQKQKIYSNSQEKPIENHSPSIISETYHMNHSNMAQGALSRLNKTKSMLRDENKSIFESSNSFKTSISNLQHPKEKGYQLAGSWTAREGLFQRKECK